MAALSRLPLGPSNTYYTAIILVCTGLHTPY